MSSLHRRLRPYSAMQYSPCRTKGLWQALTGIAGDALVLPPDPVSDARVEEICADEARQALLAHLAKL